MENDLQPILENLGIERLNEMQERMLTETESPGDIILLSRTGSGKTLAFLLPLLRDLDLSQQKTQAIIIAPSRELALQIESVFRQMKTGAKITCCYGGHKREIEENNLIDAPTIIVGTPGRMADHIRRGNIAVDTVKTLILDEFDKSLELGFEAEMSAIYEALPGIERKMLISATAASEMPAFIKLQSPRTLSFVTDDESDQPAIEVQQFKVEDKDRLQAVFELICTLGGRSTILFCNQRSIVQQVSTVLKEKGLPNVFYHGSMEQRDRDTALNRFRNGTVNLLVTTDLASRGLDIPHIRYIIHYQIPETQEVFIHRNGRTARMDASGGAIVVLGPDEYLPAYMDQQMPEVKARPDADLPPKTKWVTLYVAAGKKDKVNKVDIVGFLSKVGKLKKDDIGLIEVKDYSAFVAVSRHKATDALHRISDERLKNKKVKIEIAE